MPDAAANLPKDVFIVGSPRTGTTVLRAWLAANGGLDCDEIFTAHLDRQHSYHGYLTRRVADQPDLILPWNQRQVFEDFLGDLRGRADGLPLIIDTKYHTLNHVPQRFAPGMRRPFLFHHMKDTGAHCIQLIRRNRLRTVVSEEISKATGIWGISNKRKLGGGFHKPKLTLDPDQTLRRINRQREMDVGIRELFSVLPTYHFLRYEDMFDTEGGFSEHATQIAEAVLPGPITLRKPPHQKLNPEPLSGLVENLDAVRAVLRGTRYAWMAEDDA